MAHDPGQPRRRRDRVRGAAATMATAAALAVALGAADPAAAAGGEGSWTAPLAAAWRDVTDWDAWRADGGQWRLAVSPFSHHFRYSEEHRYVWALGVERERDDHWLAGASYFRNSFGQPSAYVFVGKRFPGLFGVEPLFAQASVGMLYGYRGKYESKVPLNVNGFSPGALAGMGWQFSPDTSATLHLLGDAGVMLQLSWRLR